MRLSLATFHPPQAPYMKNQLLELITLIGAGCMREEDIERINYDDSFPIALGEWVVLGSLPDTVLFQADSYQELFQNITDSFDKSVPFTLKPKQLARTEPLTALNRIQVQMGALNKEAGGYVLLNFSQLLDDELQMVMVGQHDLARVQELGAEVGIKVEPALEALKVAVHV